MEIKKVDFERILSENSDFSFEDLDVNGDNVIDKKDKDLTKNTEIFNRISHLLNSTDEEEQFELVDDFDYKNALKSGSTSAQCLDGNCQATLPTKTANENAATSNLNNLASTNDCPDGNCSATLPATSTSDTSTSNASTSNNDGRVVNADGTYTITTTSDSGSTKKTKYSADGKMISDTVTKKDGTKLVSTYKYNEDGSYTKKQTNKKNGTVTTTKYNAEGKAISATQKPKKGVTKKIAYKYNDDGSYQKVTTYSTKVSGNDGCGHDYTITTNYKTTQKYDAQGRITSSATKRTKKDTAGRIKNNNTKTATYKYNADGSCTKTEKDYNGAKKVTTITANGEIDKSKSTMEIQDVNASNYKNQIASKGVSWLILTNRNHCGHCDKVEEAIPFLLSKLDNSAVASVARLDIYQSDANENLLYYFMRKFNVPTGQYPFVIKFVDGKPVGMGTDLDKGGKNATSEYLANLFNGKTKGVCWYGN